MVALVALVALVRAFAIEIKRVIAAKMSRLEGLGTCNLILVEGIHAKRENLVIVFSNMILLIQLAHVQQQQFLGTDRAFLKNLRM